MWDRATAWRPGLEKELDVTATTSISFCDTTLRDGQQAAGVAFSVDDAVDIALAFTNARLMMTPVTQEADVKAVMTKVALGEVDAGVVYVTDVRAAGEKVKGIRIPTAVNASTKYPIATLTTAPNKAQTS